MKKRILLNLIFLNLLILSPSAYASKTPSYYMTGTLCEIKCVKPFGGNKNTTINIDTGALVTQLEPAFLITTNSCETKKLDLTVAANTQSGMTNAVFTSGGQHYVVLTNSDVLPPASAVTNIRTGSPTAELNPNAIAYIINNPPNIPGVLEPQYINAGDYWQLNLYKNGPVLTSIAIPTGNPFPSTYSCDDEAGRYQAVVTLTFQ